MSVLFPKPGTVGSVSRERVRVANIDQSGGWRAVSLDVGGPECFVYYLKPGKGEEYEKYHQEVWPEVIAALRLRGLESYSIFRRGDLVISVISRRSVVDVIDLPPDIKQRVDAWDALLAPLFVATTDRLGARLMARQIFHLEELGEKAGDGRLG